MARHEKAVLKVEYTGEPLLRNNEMSDENLDFFLARFVAEVRKEYGGEYPGKTIHEMIYSLQHTFCKGLLFLIDKRGCEFCNKREGGRRNW